MLLCLNFYKDTRGSKMQYTKAFLKSVYESITLFTKNHKVSLDDLTDKQWDLISLQVEQSNESSLTAALESKEQDIVDPVIENQHSGGVSKKRKLLEETGNAALGSQDSIVKNILEGSGPSNPSKKQQILNNSLPEASEATRATMQNIQNGPDSIEQQKVIDNITTKEDSGNLSISRSDSNDIEASSISSTVTSAGSMGVEITDEEIAHQVRGSIKTYAIDMMGGFNFSIESRGVIIRPDIKIRRPINVTGFLGDTAGAHVISLASFVSHIQEEIKDKTPKEAIEIIIEIIKPFSGKSYDSFKEEAKRILEQLNHSELADQLQAYNFLKTTLIPGVTAVWNQKVGSAFRGKKDGKELAVEGNEIKKMLKDSRSKFDAKVIKELVANIDYKCLSNADSINSRKADELLIKGIRTNHYTNLAYILGEVTEYYVTRYNKDRSQNVEITRKFLIEFFTQNCEWVKHFKKHVQTDFGDKRVEALKEMDPEKYKSIKDVKKLNAEDLSELIIRHLSESKPFLSESQNLHLAHSEKEELLEQKVIPEELDQDIVKNQNEVILPVQTRHPQSPPITPLNKNKRNKPAYR